MGRASETIRYHRMIEAGETPSEKWCATCKAWKSLDQVSRSRKDGLSLCCRPCSRVKGAEFRARHPERARQWHERRLATLSPEQRAAKWRRTKYGLTAEEHAAMVAQQRGVCAICRQSKDSGLVVDHDHATGAVRGLLCYACNRSLFLVERADLLSSALTYLGRFGEDHSSTSEGVEPGL